MTTPANPDDLLTWLRAQLDDDSRAIASVGAWTGGSDRLAALQGTTTMLMSARRALAEVDAKRRTLDLAASITDPHDDEQVWYQQAIGDVLRRMALPYADRPGYREEWRA